MTFNFLQTPIVLNKFFVKRLQENELSINEYSCIFKENPELGKEQSAISGICYYVGFPAIRLGNKIITQREIPPDKLQHKDWELQYITSRKIDCANPSDRKGIESLERRKLGQNLRKEWNKTAIEKSSEGRIIWWITGDAGKEKFGLGWEVHRGRRIDVVVDSDAKHYLEIMLARSS